MFTASSERPIRLRVALTSYALLSYSFRRFSRAPWHTECVLRVASRNESCGSRDGQPLVGNRLTGGQTTIRKFSFSSLTNVTECQMLVLTRKFQEKIRIGNNITITVLRMKGKAVRLGIEAPSSVPVIRGELAFAGEGEATVEVEMLDEAVETTEEEVVSPGRTFGRAAGSTAQWPTQSRVENSGGGKSRVEEPVVSLRRMSRENVSKLMPKLAAGSAPLRAIMEQR
jgi:carbon storage regulator CsrA